MSGQGFAIDVAVIGGCGHVGLPLAVTLADAGLSVCIYDTNDVAVARVLSGDPPFMEDGLEPVLARTLAEGALSATTDPSAVGRAATIIVVIGTPVDEHLNPDPQAVPNALCPCLPYLTSGQMLILRSTVYPGVTARVEQLLRRQGLEIDVTCCPERIAEGQALVELYSLPQLIGARTAEARERASELFGLLTNTLVPVSPEEAELAKLFTNSWRYIKFAAANQFYVIANDHGLDFERIRAALAYDYPRAADLPSAGFAAGPCLLKDTMQLAAFADNSFLLGHAAMLVNEGLPLYLVSRLEERYELSRCTVGILGMAFKALSDDTRSSLSYKLRRILQFRANAVLCTDPYVKDDPNLLPLDRVLDDSDLLVVATPHAEYKDIVTHKPVIDVWNLLGGGTLS